MVAVTLAAAAPVFVVATERLWLAGGADAAAAQVIDGRAAATAGVDVQVEAALDAGTVAAVDAELRRELGEIDGLAEPAAAIYTLPGIAAARSGSDLARFQARALAVDGARDAVVVRERADSAQDGGVWISSWLAERFEIGLGDELLLESGVTADEAFNDLVPGGGAAAGWSVTGIYEPIWNEDGSQPGGFWSTVPPEAVPRYLRPFRAPSFALVLVEQPELASSGLTGILRWTAPAVALPDRLADLRERRSQYRRFESSLVQGSPLADAMVEVSTPARRRPLLATSLFDLVAEAERASGRLGGPIRVARDLGLVVGFAVTASVGSFIVRRRANEFALLAGEGERWPKMALRVLAQVVPLFVGGAVIGTAAAVLTGRYLSTSGWIAVPDLGWRSIIVAAAVGLGLCAVVAGAVGQQALAVDGIDRRWIRALTAGTVIGLVALTAIFWVLAGGDAAGGADLVVAGLPLAGLGLTAVVATAGVGWLARRGRGLARRLGVVSLLAASRVAIPSPGLRMAVVGLAVGSGMVVYSTSLVTTVDRALDVKLATEVGAPTRLELFGDLPDDLDLPPRTTLLYTQDTVVSPGDRRVRVLAVDEATFADAVQWPEEYGATAEEVVTSISTGSRDTIPAVVITGEGLPGSGAIGTTQALPYRIVGRIEALPLARQFGATMMVSADRLDRFVADRNAELVAAGQDLGDNTRLPTSRFRRRVLSQLPLDVLEPAVVAEGVSVREGLSADVLARDPGRAATRLAFDYVAVVGIVALVAGAVSVALYSSGRARDQAVTTVMLATIGVPAKRRGIVSLAEVVTVVGIGAITAVGAAPILAARVVWRFDPAPGVPPDVGVVFPVAVAAILFVAVLLATTAIVLVPEGASARRSSAEVMRHAG